MKSLNSILSKVNINSVIGNTDITISTINFDSRKVTDNSIFIALKGTLSNGHDFIDTAIKNGATVIICEKLPKTQAQKTTYITVSDTYSTLAQIASNYYDKPSKKLKLIGITGTNGKTTIASLLFELFKNAGYNVGLLSTVNIKINNKTYKATHTTPNALAINNYLSEMVNNDVEYCFMEVSSHGIHQKRIDGLHFEGGIFSNLSHDHLDYHNSFAEYRDIKKQFFDQLPKTAFALTNLDDKNGSFMLQNTKSNQYTYALKTNADFKATILENQLSGLLLKINNIDVYTKLIGSFNAYNILAIFATAKLLGLADDNILKLISNLNSVSGRFQYLIKNSITVIVDYAHTPDALKNVLETINNIRTKNEQLITVVGCGGDRDKSKRPIMAKIATSLSTKVIFTSDNPRTEDPDVIISEMENGVPPTDFKKTLSITSRAQAIKTACQLAQSNDIILIAGKGHENYQEINGVRTHFDDFETATNLLNKLN